MILPREPSWKSFIVITKDPIFTPDQCDKIIEVGRSLPKQQAEIGGVRKGEINTNKRLSNISFIPFESSVPMYRELEKVMLKYNRNHFGFEGMQIAEHAQYTEYSEGGFYNWHVDSFLDHPNQPPVRKISMSCLLSREDEFEGGDMEFFDEDRSVKLKQGHAVFFASFIRHKVQPVKRGNRKSLVIWFGGPPFK